MDNQLLQSYAVHGPEAAFRDIPAETYELEIKLSDSASRPRVKSFEAVPFRRFSRRAGTASLYQPTAMLYLFSLFCPASFCQRCGKLMDREIIRS